MNQKENKIFPHNLELKKNGNTKLALGQKSKPGNVDPVDSRPDPESIKGHAKKRKYFFGEVTPVKNDESASVSGREGINHRFGKESLHSPNPIQHIQLDHRNLETQSVKGGDLFLTPFKSRSSLSLAQKNQQSSSPTKDREEGSDFSDNVQDVSLSSQDAQVTWNISPPKLVLLSSQLPSRPAIAKSGHDNTLRKSIQEPELWDRQQLEDSTYEGKNPSYDVEDPASNLLQKYNARSFPDDSEEVSSTFPSFHPPSSGERKQQSLKLRRINSEITPSKALHNTELSNDNCLKNAKSHRKYQLRSPRSLRRSLSTNDALKNGLSVTDYMGSETNNSEFTSSESSAYDYRVSRPLLSTRSSRYAGKHSSISKILSLADNLPEMPVSSSDEILSCSNDPETYSKAQNLKNPLPTPRLDTDIAFIGDGPGDVIPIARNSTPSSPPVVKTSERDLNMDIAGTLDPFEILDGDEDDLMIDHEPELEKVSGKIKNDVVDLGSNSDFSFDDDEEILKAVMGSLPVVCQKLPTKNEIGNLVEIKNEKNSHEVKAEPSFDPSSNHDEEILDAVRKSREVALINDHMKIEPGITPKAATVANYDHFFDDDDSFYGIETKKKDGNAEEISTGEIKTKVEGLPVVTEPQTIIDYDNLFDDEDDEDLAIMDRMIEEQVKAEKLHVEQAESKVKVETRSEPHYIKTSVIVNNPVTHTARENHLPANTEPSLHAKSEDVSATDVKCENSSVKKAGENFYDLDSDGFDFGIDISEQEMQDIAIQAKIQASISQSVVADVASVKLESNATDKINEISEVKLRQSDPPRLDINHIIGKPNCHRYLVKDVQVGVFKTEIDGQVVKYDEYFLTVITAEDLEVSVHLRDNWYEAPSQPCVGDIIHIIGEYDHLSVDVVLDRSNNLLIINPDILVTCTATAEAFRCARSVLLKERIREMTASNKYMMFGTILHEIIQACLSSGLCSEQKLHAELKLSVQAHLQEIFTVDETPDSVTNHIRSKIPAINNWFGKYLGAKPLPYAFIEDSENSYKTTLSITDIIDLEEEIYSPIYGLKGKIDCTAQAIIDNPKYTGKYLVPLEVKTGSRYGYLAHRAQTSLYTLMMSDRYEMDINFGLLYYSESGDTIKIPAVWKEHRDLLIQRNNIAKYLKSERELPDMIRDERECGKCFKKKECMIYHKTKDHGTPETSGVPRLFNENTHSIEPQHSAFFNHWDTLLSKEEKETERFKKDLWTLTGAQREKSGRCFSDMIVKSQKMIKEGVEKKFEIVFEKRSDSGNTIINYSDYSMMTGETIIISDEEGHFCLATGFLKSITRRSVTVLVNRRVSNSRQKLPGFDFGSNQVFMSMLSSSDNDLLTSGCISTKTFRIDPDEFASAIRVARNNLIQLLMPTGDLNRRSLIVDFAPPKFKKDLVYYDRSSIASFNDDQKEAIDQIMKAEDYSLLLGMPGTGKTTTIAQIIRMLVKADKSVLLASYTHSAVDNILLKLLDDDIKILRLGSSSKVHAGVSKYAESNKGKTESAEELREIYMKPSVVATTCLGINHWLFSRRRFDYCIVDEASQLTLPLCLGPLRFADKFVLVGDHYQLSPLVKNPEALSGGLDVSLFKSLCERNPQAVTNLTYQYRMCKDIMLLSNTLIYEGKLKCGTEAVANQALRVPFIRGMDSWKPNNLAPQKDWLSPVMNSENRVMFLNTDNIPEARETSINEKGVHNEIETEIVRQITECLCTCGVSEGSIGILSFYRSQLYKISNVLRHRSALEILTADRFQGRDKDCIIISLVRSNDTQYVGDLLRDWRRLNVTFTRAMSKIIIVGSQKTLGGVEVLGKFFSLIKQQGWIYDLPIDCVNIYHCPPVSSSTQEGSWSQALRSSASKSSVKVNDENKDSTLSHSSGTSTDQRNVFRVGMKALNSRPILRDVVNNQL